MFFLKKGHFFVSELYIYQNVRCNDKKYIYTRIANFCVSIAKTVTVKAPECYVVRKYLPCLKNLKK